MSGEEICVYQRQLQRWEPDLTHAGVAGQNFGAVQWLKDGRSEMVTFKTKTFQSNVWFFPTSLCGV